MTRSMLELTTAQAAMKKELTDLANDLKTSRDELVEVKDKIAQMEKEWNDKIELMEQEWKKDKDELAKLKAVMPQNLKDEIQAVKTEISEMATVFSTGGGNESESFAQRVKRNIADSVETKFRETIGDKLNTVDKKITKISNDSDRDRRAKNFILLGVKEEKEEDRTVRTTKENRFVTDMLKHLGLNEATTIEDITRLGRFDEARKHPRALRVTVATETQKWKIIGQGKYLANMTTNNKVFVQPDLTSDEREKEKQLINELRERRAKDTSKNWMIRRGRIIERTKEEKKIENQPVGRRNSLATALALGL